MLKLFPQMFLYDSESGPGKNGKDDTGTIDDSDKTDDSKVDEGDPELSQLNEKLSGLRDKIINTKSEFEEEDKPSESETDGGEKNDKIEGKDKTLPDEIEITEDFIGLEAHADELKFEKLNPEYVKEALNSIKGKKIDKDVLKNFVHTQATLLELKSGGKQKEEDLLGAEDKAQTLKSGLELNTEGLDDKQIETMNKARVQALYAKLHPQYPDLTLDDLKDKDSVNSFISSMNINNPLDADEFKSEYKASNQSITKAVNEYKDMSQNWMTVMRNDSKTTVDKFEKEFLANKELKLKDLDKELTESYVVNNILKDDKGQLRTDLFDYYKNDKTIPIINKDRFYQALINHFDVDVTKLIEKRGATNFIDNKKRKEANPSISESNITGQEKVATPAVIPDDEYDFDNMDKILAENRKRILKADGVNHY